MKTNEHQVTGVCRRNIEFIFDVDDTERLVVTFEEEYKGGFRCYIDAKRREDFDVPFGCVPDFTLAEQAGNEWLKFHRLTPEGIKDI